MALQNLINHVVLVVDKSSSMYKHKKTVVEVVDSTVNYLAERSKDLEQETRVTIYTFSSGHKAIECLVYDMDVLRLPSMEGLYSPDGMTALIDATIKAIDDLEKTATLYGEHAFLVYVITDGQENASRNTASLLSGKIRDVQRRNNWTLAAFAPDPRGVEDAVKCGFLRDNVTLWEAGSTEGVKSVGNIIRQTSNTFMTGRKSGVHSYKSLFTLNDLTVSDITSLIPLLPGAYKLPAIGATDFRADQAYTFFMDAPFAIGKVYYQLTKKETIQANKNIAILFGGKVYTGPQARQKLGLPNSSVDVTPGDSKYKGYTIFVQSTAPNRKLLAGTHALLLK
jgi:hypothetical protein